jgi:hypothetical protein
LRIPVIPKWASRRHLISERSFQEAELTSIVPPSIEHSQSKYPCRTARNPSASSDRMKRQEDSQSFGIVKDFSSGQNGE